MLDQRDTLRNIRTFPQLIKFLRDELDWPIESEDFEELTFDYTAEELGIDTASAAKIQEIKRLRPLSASQPWGIFFVKFEPKRLPVVALRRMLSRVVLKKRASANSADRAAWQVDDLLFVSNYGEGAERQISFAHFSQNAEKADLPTLKVLGWDNRDTALHLDDVADTLHQRLAWPEDEQDAKRWREQWRSAFTLRHREVITTSKDLAVRLAELARAIRDRIQTVLAIETEKGRLTKLMRGFQQALIHDLSADDFADMYAQTIAYGLLSARVAHPAHDTADAVSTHIPVTNPFLKELMETFLHLGGRRSKERGGDGIDFDELGVSEVVELLDSPIPTWKPSSATSATATGTKTRSSTSTSFSSRSTTRRNACSAASSTPRSLWCPTSSAAFTNSCKPSLASKMVLRIRPLGMKCSRATKA